jgi:uncharacterized protein
MLEDIRRIKNPFVRTFTSAAMAFAVFTIITAAVMGVINSKNKSAATFAVYSSLLATGFGGILGFALMDCKDDSVESSERKGKQGLTKLGKTEVSLNNNTWKDWRNFVVVRKVRESEEITSFYLRPEDKGEINNYQPGQFLTIKLNIPGQDKPIIRTYSLSDYAQPCEYYRLSVKRETTPQGLNVPAGIASNFLHDSIQQGSVIQAKPPIGKFFLDLQKSTPAVFISNGVGITPMLSMAKACTHLNPNRPIWFIHGAKNSLYHAFWEEISAIALQNPNLTTHFRYSRPRPEDNGLYHSTGYVDINLIQQLVEKSIGQKAEFFLCGSPAFMESLRNGLKEWGIPENQVFFESFSKPIPIQSTNQSVSQFPNQNPTVKSTVNSTDSVKEAEIVFAKSGKTLIWKQGDGSILDFAEANDINPDYSCRAGICGTCMCKIRSGKVDYQETPSASINDGSVLICISQPSSSKVVLDL